MCGIVGVVSQSPVNQLIYDSLLLLQHRGQDAAGIATANGSNFHMHKANGMVRDVFRTRNMRSLPGTVGIGQVRYPTAGSASSEEEAQPFYVNAPFGIILAHNGNLTNWQQLKDEMFRVDRRHINTNSDTEVMLNVLAHELQLSSSGLQLDPAALFKAVSGVHRRVARVVCNRVADRGLRPARVPRPVRHPAALHRQAGNAARHRMDAGVGIGRAGRHRLRIRARRAAGRSHFHRPRRQFPRAAVRAESEPQSVHLRTRVSRAAGFGARRRAGLQRASADGRLSRRKDHACAA